VGDEVYGASRGTFAEYVVASVDKVAPKPPQLTFEQAAVMPYPSFVALQALRDHGQVRPGQRVLVVGASGAVGSIAVQLAVAFGATVTGVCSAANADLVRSLGASDVIDYRTGDLTAGPHRFDLIIDIGGRTSVARLRRALTPAGTLVIVGGEGDKWIGGIQRQLWAGVVSLFVPRKLKAFVVKEHRDELLVINELVAQGLAPVMGASFSLEDGIEAVRAFETGKHEGRVVIRR
jgi:NADPH:quinone reductase-like Zn-dependent oxidoreductase